MRYLLGWLRTITPGQHCQALLTFNPPTDSDGRWVIEFFAPWLDRKHPNPAAPGEIRYAASLPADEAHPNGRDLWLEDARPFVLVNGEPCYDFDPLDYPETEIITPKSRTFIPSRISDNPYLMGTGYLSQLQALPEPLRSQMMNGDFYAGVKDDPWQVIPTAWVEAAMERWEKPPIIPEMMTVGVDVARGGDDKTVIARKHKDNWFDEPLTYPGKETPDGPHTASLVIAAMRDSAPIAIDVIGVGSSPYDFLKTANQPVFGINVAEKSTETDQSGRLEFSNLRSQLWWQMREALDPANNTGIRLPPDKRLLQDLCAPMWSLKGKVLYVESREEIYKRIRRSPDWASAYILALIDIPKRFLVSGVRGNEKRSYDPYARIGRN